MTEAPNKYRAAMVLNGLEVVLATGTRDECIAAIRKISGTPGITRVGMARVREGKGEGDGRSTVA